MAQAEKNVYLNKALKVVAVTLGTVVVLAAAGNANNNANMNTNNNKSPSMSWCTLNSAPYNNVTCNHY